MKKITITTLITSTLLISAAELNAASPGAYLGAGAGYSVLDDSSLATKEKDGGLGGRGFIGYNFNHYLGVETNYTSMFRTKYRLNDYPGLTIDYRLNALSLVLKGYLPISDSGAFNLYGLIGAAQMYSNSHVNYHLNTYLTDSDSALVHNLGFGASYDLTQRFSTSFEISGFGEKDSDYYHLGIPQSSLATLSLAYKF
jgi:hypothetical protein